jgi:hypothetical protein
MKRNKIILMLCSVMIILAAAMTSAVPNDPGHDTLYIEQQGDSSLNGSINITNRTYAYKISISDLFYSPYLDILGNGTRPGNSRAEIYTLTDQSTLVINAGQSLYLLKEAGTMVYIGDSGVALNVSGALYVRSATAMVNGQNICLQNGINCPSNLSGANITANGATPGYIAQFQSAAILNNSIISQTVDNISIDRGVLFVDGTNNQVGIFTLAPTQKLDVNGSINISSTTGAIYAPRIFQNGTQVAGKGNCAVGLFVQNITNGTPECGTPTATGDGNNYTTSIGFTTSGSTTTLNLNRSGSTANITADFTDKNNLTTSIGFNRTANTVQLSLNISGSTANITSTFTDNATGNCSTDQSCPNILYDTNATNFMTATTDNWINSTGDTATGNYTFDTNTLHIDSTNDRVGIGTTSPNETLTITGNLSVTGSTNSSIDSGTLFIDATNDRVGIGTTSPSEKLNVNGSLRIDNSIGRIILYVNSTSGRVGIGTTSNSGYRLIVNGTTDITGTTTINSGSGGGATTLQIVGNALTGQQATASGGNILIDAGTSGNVLLNTVSTGNVGIGTTSPNETLTITGNLSVTGSTNSSIDSGTLFIDATNNRVGIGTTTPSASLQIFSSTFDNHLLINRTGAPDVHLSTSSVSPAAGILWAGSDYAKGIYFDINGQVTINGNLVIKASTAITCNAGNAGTIYYNSTTNKHYGCNSTIWNALY